jgi:hypothetical protein
MGVACNLGYTVGCTWVCNPLYKGGYTLPTPGLALRYTQLHAGYTRDTRPLPLTDD